ncbi:hypothetical protein RND81_04G072400 [Saponaria officinalis]|uniref:Uncharacterized protein n=1 Tax=Saponaria officinalis TaxID=3572 RepID=A0AAW1LH85_SAPOF
MAEDSYVGFEEGLSWLPSHILHDACGHLHQEQLVYRTRHYQHRYHVNCFNSLPLLPPGEQWSSEKKNQHARSRYRSNRTTGGPGMQAVFLEPARKTCGTGVFLPRRCGSELKPTKSPACSPVLLPYRVVQALNLNVRALGLQTSPYQGD